MTFKYFESWDDFDNATLKESDISFIKEGKCIYTHNSIFGGTSSVNYIMPDEDSNIMVKGLLFHPDRASTMSAIQSGRSPECLAISTGYSPFGTYRLDACNRNGEMFSYIIRCDQISVYGECIDNYIQAGPIDLFSTRTIGSLNCKNRFAMMMEIPGDRDTFEVTFLVLTLDSSVVTSNNYSNWSFSVNALAYAPDSYDEESIEYDLPPRFNTFYIGDLGTFTSELTSQEINYEIGLTSDDPWIILNPDVCKTTYDENNHELTVRQINRKATGGVTEYQISLSSDDTYVNSATFASTGTSGANGIIMTLGRTGGVTSSVTATIPIATTQAAGVITGNEKVLLNNITAEYAYLEGQNCSSESYYSGNYYLTIDPSKRLNIFTPEGGTAGFICNLCMPTGATADDFHREYQILIQTLDSYAPDPEPTLRIGNLFGSNNPIMSDACDSIRVNGEYICETTDGYGGQYYEIPLNRDAQGDRDFIEINVIYQQQGVNEGSVYPARAWFIKTDANGEHKQETA